MASSAPPTSGTITSTLERPTVFVVISATFDDQDQLSCPSSDIRALCHLHLPGASGALRTFDQVAEDKNLSEAVETWLQDLDSMPLRGKITRAVLAEALTDMMGPLRLLAMTQRSGTRWDLLEPVVTDTADLEGALQSRLLQEEAQEHARGGDVEVSLLTCLEGLRQAEEELERRA